VTVKDIQFPFYVKATYLMTGLFVLAAILYIAGGIIVPVIFSLFLAILLNPVVKFFVKMKINRVVAIVFTLFLTILIIAAFGALLFSQANRFADTWPLLVDKFTLVLKQGSDWASSYFDINPLKIDAWLLKTKNELISSSSGAIGQTLVSVGSAILILFLIPLYIFLILFYQPLLLDFIRKVFKSSDPAQVGVIISQTKSVIQRYLLGLVIEAIIVATLNSAALLILGIQYAILLGIIGALLNVIPYIGGVVAVCIPMMIALVTKSSAWYSVYVLAAYYIIQMIDNNFIVPKIVASRVKINALFAIIVVLAGNALWGLPGMFLSLPLLAVIKVIFDHIEPLKPWGFLLGDTMPPVLKIKHNLIKPETQAS